MNIMNNDRFKGLDWVQDDYPEVMVIGAGGISSWLSLFLSRIGVPIHIFDHDIVEEHNIGGQLFNYDSIGKYKVNAVKNICTNLCGSINVMPYNEKINSDILRQILNPLSYPLLYRNVDFIFSGVDNIFTRNDVVKYLFIESNNKSTKKIIFIDGRLLAETFQIYVVTKDNYDQYIREAVFLDSEAEENLPCTAKQTSHIGAMIACMMTGYFTNILFNQKVGENIRDVPFFTSYDLSSNVLITRDKVDVVNLSNDEAVF